MTKKHSLYLLGAAVAILSATAIAAEVYTPSTINVTPPAASTEAGQPQGGIISNMGPESVEMMSDGDTPVSSSGWPGDRGHEGHGGAVPPPVPVPDGTASSDPSMGMGEPGVSGGSSGGMGDDMGMMPPQTAPEPACGHQELVGQQMSDSILKSIKGPVRVLYPDSMATMDYSPDRVNIILEKGTDKIIEVRCG